MSRYHAEYKRPLRVGEKARAGAQATVAFIAAVAAALLLGAALPSGASTPEVEAPQDVARVSAWFAAWGDVPEGKVSSWRQKGMAWSEIARVLLVARRSGKPIVAVNWLRDAGLSWDDIARRFGYDPAEIASQAEQAERAALGDGPAKPAGTGV